MIHIVQMADFHFGYANTEPDYERKILSRMAQKINGLVPAGEDILLCACGDYIDGRPVKTGRKSRSVSDSEAEERYAEAEAVLTECLIDVIKENHAVHIGMCMGNHDVSHIPQLQEFSEKLQKMSARPYSGNIASVYSIHFDRDNTDFIFLNSCALGDHAFGSVDYNELDCFLGKLSPSSGKYLVMHHTVMSMDDGDASSVRHAARLVYLIDKYNIRAVLHGHVHGEYTVRIGRNGCPVIGVGAVFARDYANVNSQFNLISCGFGMLSSAKNHAFRADVEYMEGADPFADSDIAIAQDGNFFFNERISAAYDALVRKVCCEKKLYNVHVQTSSSFEDFEKDVNSNFGRKKELKTLDHEYSYSELAEKWEAPEHDPALLYFNHGEHFALRSNDGLTEGIEYVKKELAQKSTSSRAILLTIGAMDAAETDPDGLLPSLLSIQFSFDSSMQTLYVTMNLRALEVSRFMKINICEILYLAKKLNRSFPFKNIEVNIIAFRVQMKKNFSCFLRAKLDTVSGRELTRYLDKLEQKESDYSGIWEIAKLVQDKSERSETVVETAGVEQLEKVLAEEIGYLPDEKQREKEYVRELHGLVCGLHERLSRLKEFNTHSSEQTQTKSELEAQIQADYKAVIAKLQEVQTGR